MNKAQIEYINKDFSLDDEEEAHDFWYETIETCATEMGMKYYEDLSDEEMDEATEFWDIIR